MGTWGFTMLFALRYARNFLSWKLNLVGPPPHLREACLAHPYLGRTTVITYHGILLVGFLAPATIYNYVCHVVFVNLSKAAPPSSCRGRTVSALLKTVSPAPGKRLKVGARYRWEACLQGVTGVSVRLCTANHRCLGEEERINHNVFWDKGGNG